MGDTDSFGFIIGMIDDSLSSGRLSGSTKPGDFRLSNFNDNNGKPVFGG